MIRFQGASIRAIVSFEARRKALIKPFEDAEHTPSGKKKKPEPRKVDVMFHKVLSFFFKTPLSEVETKIWSAVEVWLVKNGYVDVFPWENGLG